MGCLINQGKQKLEQRDFPPIVEKDACLSIEKVELDKYQANTIKVTFKVLQGPNKNRIVYDRIGYNSSSPSVWKYQSLRSAANVPYKEDEPAQVDIEALLLHTPIIADLLTREYTNNLGENKVVQDIRYKHWDQDKFNSASVDTPDKAVDFDSPLEEEDISYAEIAEEEDGDIPFKSAVDISGGQQQDDNHNEPAKSLDYDWD